MFDFGKYQKGFKMDALVNVWLSDDDLMIILCEEKLNEVKAGMEEMGIIVKFRRLTRKEFFFQVKHYKWEQEEQNKEDRQKVWYKIDTVGLVHNAKD